MMQISDLVMTKHVFMIILISLTNQARSRVHPRTGQCVSVRAFRCSRNYVVALRWLLESSLDDIHVHLGNTATWTRKLSFFHWDGDEVVVRGASEQLREEAPQKPDCQAPVQVLQHVGLL